MPGPNMGFLGEKLLIAMDAMVAMVTMATVVVVTKKCEGYFKAGCLSYSSIPSST